VTAICISLVMQFSSGGNQQSLSWAKNAWLSQMASCVRTLHFEVQYAGKIS